MSCNMDDSVVCLIHIMLVRCRTARSGLNVGVFNLPLISPEIHDYGVVVVELMSLIAA